MRQLEAVRADPEIRTVFPDGHAVKITRFSEEAISFCELAGC